MLDTSGNGESPENPVAPLPPREHIPRGRGGYVFAFLTWPENTTRRFRASSYCRLIP